MKIGILREGKVPPDRRVPFSPKQCKSLIEKYSDLDIVVQPSNIRCFKDEEYLSEGIPMNEDLSDCDVLMGVKEVNKEDLIPNKTHLFFSHTIKKQDYNKELLQVILKENIRLIDYEILTDNRGLRIIGFGRFAGLVGAYNGLRAYALRLGLPALKPAHLCADLKEMNQVASDFEMPNINIVVTGGGRVSQGAMEILDTAGVKEVSVEDFLNKSNHDTPVYVQIEPDHYVKRKDGSSFDLQHFFDNPDQYENNFERFLPHTDLLIPSAYWDPKSPVLFTQEHMKEKDFPIKVIADITCDIDGSVPSTKKATTVDDPFYDYNRLTGEMMEPFSDEDNITVMSVDNLPCELPKDASLSFGTTLSEEIVPALMGNDPDEIINRASITLNGSLTENYRYLEDWVNS